MLKYFVSFNDVICSLSRCVGSIFEKKKIISQLPSPDALSPVMHTCDIVIPVSNSAVWDLLIKPTNIGSDKGLSPGRRQAIISTNIFNFDYWEQVLVKL